MKNLPSWSCVQYIDLWSRDHDERRSDALKCVIHIVNVFIVPDCFSSTSVFYLMFERMADGQQH